MCGESIGAITFDYGDLERSVPRSLRFRRLISRKGPELDPVLLIKTHRKSHMGSRTAAASHLTLRELKWLQSRSPIF